MTKYFTHNETLKWLKTQRVKYLIRKAINSTRGRRKFGCRGDEFISMLKSMGWEPAPDMSPFESDWPMLTRDNDNNFAIAV